MAYLEVLSVEIREIIRRWQAGLSQRRIARGTGLSRQTVRRYIDAAEAAGLKPGGPEPSEEQLARLATLSPTRPRQVAVPSEELLAPWAEQVEGWLTAEAHHHGGVPIFFVKGRATDPGWPARRQAAADP